MSLANKLTTIQRSDIQAIVINPVRINAKKLGLIYPCEPDDMAFFESHPRTVVIDQKSFTYADSGVIDKEYIDDLGAEFAAKWIQERRSKWDSYDVFRTSDFALSSID